MKFYNLSALSPSAERGYFVRIIRLKGLYVPKPNLKIKPNGAWYNLEQLKILSKNYKKASRKMNFRFAETGDQMLYKRLLSFIDSIQNGEDISKYAININPMFLIREIKENDKISKDDK